MPPSPPPSSAPEPEPEPEPARPDGREERHVRLADGRRVTFAEHGDPGGRPLVFSHGWPSSRLQGRLCDEAGRRHGWRVLTPDRPGIGGTTAEPGRSLADWPPRVVAFLDALGIDDPVALLGLSGGAPYALATAAAYPDRVSRVAVMCGAVPLGEVDRALVREMMLPYRVLLALRRRGSPLVPRLVGLGRGAAALPPDHPVIRLFLRFVPPCDREVMRHREVGECVLESCRVALAGGADAVIADADPLLGRFPGDPAGIDCPVAWWHGGRDRNIPLAMARAFAARLPSAATHWLPDEGHYSLPARFIGSVLAELGTPGANSG